MLAAVVDGVAEVDERLTGSASPDLPRFVSLDPPSLAIGFVNL
jgi:hypothetical protein